MSYVEVYLNLPYLCYFSGCLTVANPAIFGSSSILAIPKAQIETRYHTNSGPNAKVWAILSGFRFNYRHNPRVSFFAQGDYMATVGKTFFGKPSRFTLRQAPQTGSKYPYENIGTGKTNISMMNIAVGVRFMMGDDRNPNVLKEIP